MPRKLNPIVKLNKDIAEGLFGHRPGRPTISRRAGGHIGRALGIDATTGTDLFHVGLVVGALAWFGKSRR
jgi:hypothetical protein